MPRLLPIATLLSAVLLSACASSPEAEVVADPAASADSRCDAAQVQNLVGQRITSELAEQARNKSGAQLLRVTQPNQAVTMDYNPLRLNIDIDDADSIIRLNCG